MIICGIKDLIGIMSETDKCKHDWAKDLDGAVICRFCFIYMDETLESFE